MLRILDFLLLAHGVNVNERKPTCTILAVVLIQRYERMMVKLDLLEFSSHIYIL